MALRIKKLRLERGWTQETLASKAGLSRNHLSMIETETRSVNTLKLNAIAAALGVTTEELFETDPRQQRVMTIMRTLGDSDANALLRVAEALASRSQPED